MRIESLIDLEGTAEAGGVSRTISLWLTPEARVGDYVYVHAGYAISLVDEDEALESLSLLRELAEVQHQHDSAAVADDR